MYEADAAEAVVASKGPRVRQQLDAGEAKRDVGATVVALTFNDPQKALPVPADCMHRKLKSNMHPTYRVGDKLSAKFSKASLNLSSCVCVALPLLSRALLLAFHALSSS